MINFTKIKLIIWDLDETLWQGTLSDNDNITLRNEFVDFIQASLDRGIVHSICSKNDFEHTKTYLLTLGLWDLFVFPSISWDPKGARIKNIIQDMNLRAENILFVDDNTSNLQEAIYYCPELQTCTPQELLNSVAALSEITKIDTSRPRLAQYRLLEKKAEIQQEFNSNEAFLQSCNIRVTLHDDCMDNIDRIHDLILRSNQLNYTKFRQDKEELRRDLALSNTKAAYITANDAFGDYGIVGFYMIVNEKVVHFLFSCRTLGMFVEQYVYMHIGCPKIDVVGEVITQLNTTDIPKWINQKDPLHDTQNSRSNIGDRKILFKGPCDIQQIFSFIEETSEIKAELTYINNEGISVEGYNHTSQIVTALTASDDDKSKLIRETPWLDEKMLDASSWHGNDVIVFSLLSDGNLGVYQHKETGWQISLCEKYYNLTDENTWEDYVNEKIFTSSIPFTREMLADFAAKYEYVSNSEGNITINNLDVLYCSKGSNTKLILLLGTETPFNGFTPPSYENRHIFHKLLNEKVRAWATDKNDVHLIEIGKHITSQRDYLDTINHFQKKVYYYIAQDILTILNNEHTSIKIKSKFYLYWDYFKRWLSKTLGKLRRRT